MKKTWIIGFILIIGLVVVGYNKAEANDSPTSVVKQLYDAFIKGDEKTFSELWVNPEVALFLYGMATWSDDNADKERKDLAEILRTAKFEETVNGDKAIVKIIKKNGSTDKFDLMKIDGKWKIYL